MAQTYSINVSGVREVFFAGRIQNVAPILFPDRLG